jgi:hypothetical protein
MLADDKLDTPPIYDFLGDRDYSGDSLIRQMSPHRPRAWACGEVGITEIVAQDDNWHHPISTSGPGFQQPPVSPVRLPLPICPKG